MDNHYPKWMMTGGTSISGKPHGRIRTDETGWICFSPMPQGLSVIIDRTDINVEQRAPWAQLAKSKAPNGAMIYGRARPELGLGGI